MIPIKNKHPGTWKDKVIVYSFVHSYSLIHLPPNIYGAPTRLQALF